MTAEIRLRKKYRSPGSAKQTGGKGKAGGNSGSRMKSDKGLPTGIRRRPRRRYVS